MSAQQGSDDPFRITLGIEPLNRFETDFLNPCDQGIKLIQAIGSKTLKLRLDMFHRNIAEKSSAQTTNQCVRFLAQRLACDIDWVPRAISIH